MAADPFIEELFHRVSGELRTHAFAISQEEGSHADTSPSAAQSLLARTGADACVFLNWRGDTSVVHVWVAGPAGSDGAPALFEAVALQRTPEAPTILAARAVDLLSAALKSPAERAAGTPSRGTPTNPAGVTTAAASPGPPSTGETAGSHLWFLSVSAGLCEELAGFGMAWGPRLSLEHVVAPATTAALRVAGAFGAEHANNAASARLIQAFALGEVLREVAHAGAFTLRGGGGLGVYFIRTKGAIAEGIASIVPTRENQITAAAALSAEAVFALAPRWAAIISAQALLLLPRPNVVVGRETVAMMEPLLAATTGLRVAF